MNWGYKIALVYLGFVALIITMVFRTCGEKTDLEYSDYYQREVNYQTQINSSTALINSGLQPEVIVSSAQVEIQIPDSLCAEPFRGTVELHRTNDAALDVACELSSIQQGAIVPIGKLVAGLYDVRLNWSSNGSTYYYETTVTIP